MSIFRRTLQHLGLLLLGCLLLAGCNVRGQLPQLVVMETVETVDETGRPVSFLRAEMRQSSTGPVWTRGFVAHGGSIVAATPLVRGVAIDCAKPPPASTCSLLVLPRGAFWPLAYRFDPNAELAEGTYPIGEDGLQVFRQPLEFDRNLRSPPGFSPSGAALVPALGLLADVFVGGLSPGYRPSLAALELFSPYWEQAAAVFLLVLVAGLIRLAVGWWLRRKEQRTLPVMTRILTASPVLATAIVPPLFHLTETLFEGSATTIGTHPGLFGGDVETLLGRSGIEALSELTLSLAAMLVPVVLWRGVMRVVRGI